MRKVIFLLLFVFILLISGCSCKKQEQQSEYYELKDNEFCDYKFIIGIKGDYKYKYGNFTIEDFNYENVDHFTYMSWLDKFNECYMVIYLKKLEWMKLKKQSYILKNLNLLVFVKRMKLVILRNISKNKRIGV